jgi:sorbitol-specific phosphotransferase system component IIA
VFPDLVGLTFTGLVGEYAARTVTEPGHCHFRVDGEVEGAGAFVADPPEDHFATRRQEA